MAGVLLSVQRQFKCQLLSGTLLGGNDGHLHQNRTQSRPACSHPALHPVSTAVWPDRPALLAATSLLLSLRAMERRPTGPRLFCMLLLGAALDVWASTTPELGGINSVAVEATSHDATTTKSAPVSPSNAVPPPADLTGSCRSWARWETMALMGGAALVSALLISTVTLSCQVCRLRRRAHTGRSPRTNVDLVSGMGYPTSSRGGSREAVGGGASEASVRMEEVKLLEEVGQEVVEEEEEEEEEETAGMGAIDKAGDSGKGAATLESSAQAGSQSEFPQSPLRRKWRFLWWCSRRDLPACHDSVPRNCCFLLSDRRLISARLLAAVSTSRGHTNAPEIFHSQRECSDLTGKHRQPESPRPQLCF
ncbi:hypothetical protein AAFF_G00213540 [Aldrovandia affinis]|uniref:Uncharacterized protein n=1 Tax=Aldrovandia affinis TaxID=143900 RepID=A0AAD7W4F9_9TELE|nr:hypothetical protein AAFF_G00213540 [Aldrovandia affinis]